MAHRSKAYNVGVWAASLGSITVGSAATMAYLTTRASPLGRQYGYNVYPMHDNMYVLVNRTGAMISTYYPEREYAGKSPYVGGVSISWHNLRVKAVYNDAFHTHIFDHELMKDKGKY